MKKLKIYQTPDFGYLEVIHTCHVLGTSPLSAGESTLHPEEGEADTSEAGEKRGIWDNEEFTSSSSPF